MLYFLGSPSGITIEEFVDLGNNEHFSKLTCSVLPTVDYWKNMNNQISTNIIAEDYNICFEYPVKSIKKAKASYTDVMLILLLKVNGLRMLVSIVKIRNQKGEI